MKAKNIVFVHGLFGWGPDELFGKSYWGYALQQFRNDFEVHEAGCGPVSSFHDRACEVYAGIKGTTVDYGEKHSADAGHHRTSGKSNESPLVRDWSEENPVILVGHSAGAQTCMQLQQLLADDFWGEGTNARWVEAIVCVAGVINGSTLAYLLGADKESGKLNGISGKIAGDIPQLLDKFGQGRFDKVYDFDLKHWTGGREESRASFLANLHRSQFGKGEDNLAFDLTLQGCQKANKKFSSNKDTYYLSIVTAQTKPARWFSGAHLPEWQMNPLLRLSAEYQGFFSGFNKAAIEGWGSGDLTSEKWRENDGAVSSISQRYPFTAGNHAVGGEGVFARDSIKRGKWYYERAEKSTGHSFDHLDVVFGCDSEPGIIGAHMALYQNLCMLLRCLP